MTTPPQVIRVSDDIQAAVTRMQKRAEGRVSSMDRARKVRRGEFALVWPDKFSNDYPEPIVANMVDVFARDMAANIAPLPSLSCSAGAMRTTADKQRAEKKNRIGFNYWRHSRLERQMKYGADQYKTYGFLPFWVEADYAAKMPMIHVLDPIGCFWDMDRWLRVIRFARVYRQSLREIATQFPEYESQILNRTNEAGRPVAQDPENEIDVVQYVDDEVVALYLPDRAGLVLAGYEHKQEHCPVHVALRPGVETDPRGTFDDVLWVQLAHAVMAALTLEAGHKAVQAPIALPSDVQEIGIGPDAVIVSDQPEKIGRVALEVPSAAFALGQTLQQELQQGSGTPASRLGIGPAGGSTGRGISALEGGFDTQIKQDQDVLGEALRCVTEMCFAMDAKLWPRASKTIRGTLSGESFEITYVPGRDIGDTSCDVTYGFASGLSPNSAIVTMLQLRGDQIIGRDTFRRNLPIDIDVDQQQRELDEQTLEDAVMQGLAAALQASGQMFAAGQQQEALTFYQAAVQIIKGRRQGKDMADLIDQVLIQPVLQQQQQAQQQAAAAGPPGPPGAGPDDGSGDLAGVGATGLPQGVAQGQAGLPPGGRPSVQDLTAAFSSSGSPNLGDTVRRRVPTG